MFKPVYTINAKILSNIKQISILVTELNNKRFPQIIFAELERNAREISAFSSTSIEGNPLPLTDVKRILRHSPKYIRDTEKEVINYNKALEYFRDLSEKDHVVMTSDLILTIHSIVMKDLIGAYDCGKFRTKPVFVNDPLIHKTVYLPPDHGDVITLVNDLISYVTKNEKNIDPLILAGLFHRQMVIIHPFIDGNGRTTRLATKVLLAHMGLDTFNLFSFENYYNKNVSRYFALIGLVGNYYELHEQIDHTLWLEYFTDGIIDELLRVKKELEKTSSNPVIGLRLEYEMILTYIAEHGSITDSQYSKMTKRAKATRALDWNKMIALGLILRKGKGKNSYYVRVENQ